MYVLLNFTNSYKNNLYTNVCLILRPYSLLNMGVHKFPLTLNFGTNCVIFGASESFTVCSKIGVWGNSKIISRNPDVWEYSKIIVLLHKNHRLTTYKPVFSFSYFYLFKSLGGGGVGPHGKPCIVGKTHDTVRGLNTHSFYSILWQSFPTEV